MALFAHNSVGEQFRRSQLGRSLLGSPEITDAVAVTWELDLGLVGSLVSRRLVQVSLRSRGGGPSNERPRFNGQSASQIYPWVTFAHTPQARVSQTAKPSVGVRSTYTV